MKTGTLAGFLLMLLGLALLYSHGDFAVIKPSADELGPRSVITAGSSGTLLLAEAGWFIVGTGAVLMVLNVQDRRLRLNIHH